jgi:methyltransferase family protein
MPELPLADVAYEFPIASQTSVADKLALLQIRGIMDRQLSEYSYLEIGSFLGGSLTPFLRDPHCRRILSIDERNRQQPDERGIRYDYVGITHQTMIDGLRTHGFDVGKLQTFDGSVSAYRDAGEKFDLAFIDGEHTDLACFRDFIHSRPLLKDDAIVVFHDSSLVYKALRIIQELLVASGERFRFIKIRNSEISCIFRNGSAQLALEEMFPVEPDLPGFYANAENALLTAVIKNRLTVNLGLKDMPLAKAY